MTIKTAKDRISALTETEGFYENVRKIIGYYDGVIWSDHDIKQLQRIADRRFEEIGG